MNCKNCNAEVQQNFCPNCGQAIHLHRIDGHYILHEIKHVLHFEKGILYTIAELAVNPGPAVRHFITENRNRLVKPVLFVIITSLLYTIINHLFHIEEGYIKLSDEHTSATSLIFKWVEEHYGYANIIMGVFIALWVKLFFKKYQFNFFEILILLCFVMGMSMLVYSLFAIIQGLTHFNLLQAGGIVALVYSVWAIGQFFDKGKLINYFKSLVAYVLGMLTFVVAGLGLGMLIDWVMKLVR